MKQFSDSITLQSRPFGQGGYRELKILQSLIRSLPQVLIFRSEYFTHKPPAGIQWNMSFSGQKDEFFNFLDCKIKEFNAKNINGTITHWLSQISFVLINKI